MLPCSRPRFSHDRSGSRSDNAFRLPSSCSCPVACGSQLSFVCLAEPLLAHPLHQLIHLVHRLCRNRGKVSKINDGSSEIDIGSRKIDGSVGKLEATDPPLDTTQSRLRPMTSAWSKCTATSGLQGGVCAGVGGGGELQNGGPALVAHGGEEWSGQPPVCVVGG
uniref:Uncharacterized protein n=1 Tax=Setaria viridis TaxID=4556 RepID=A0A4U6W7I1_SETVI|nr:hypothetical protein SEVIR_1G127800v2 [Setaria viridis]